MDGRTNTAVINANAGGIKIPLKAPSALNVIANTSNSLAITWTDPEDEYSQPSNVLVGEFAYTRIVRKVGSEPVNANDGELVVESAVRNQYQSTPFIDTNLNPNVYYYGAFSFTIDGIESSGMIVMYEMDGYDSVFENNSWDKIAKAIQDNEAQDMWPIGSTKSVTFTNGETLDFELRSYDAPIMIYDPDDMYGKLGYDACMFISKHLAARTCAFASDETGRGIDWYFDSDRLKPRIDSYYDAMPADLKPYLVQMNLHRPLYCIPLNETLCEHAYPTQSQRIKKLDNGNGEAMHYWLMDVINDDTWNYGTFVDETGAIDTKLSDTASGPEYAHRMNRPAGVCFAFFIEHPTQ